MNYMWLIHQGNAPTPRDPDRWGELSEDDQRAIFADYEALAEAPGVTPGLQMQELETATTVRVKDAATLTTDGPFVAIALYLVRSLDVVVNLVALLLDFLGALLRAPLDLLRGARAVIIAARRHGVSSRPCPISLLDLSVASVGD